MEGKTVAVLSYVLIFAASTYAAGTEKVLYSFTGGIDGNQPYSGVIFDKAGNLYGTTQFGGAHGQGTVFQLTPSMSGWTESVLYSFTGGSDGGVPIAGVILDGAGSLYGTASSGGDPVCQCGTVFQLVPSTGGWTIKVLHSFTGGSDGASPGAGLVFDLSGNLAGTTVHGGNGHGTAFILTLSGSSWTETRVYRFTGNNGNQPWASLTADGVGTTYAGGPSGNGNVFRLRGSAISVQHTFGPTSKAGTHPLSGLISDNSNNFYGTTLSGSTFNGGAVIQLIPNCCHDTLNAKALHSFSGSDGFQPAAGLIFDGAGNLYGTTISGGTSAGYGGTVFKLTPGAKKWTESVLYSFTGGSVGNQPYAGVVLDQAGNLYGTTLRGGTYGAGVVFEVTP